MAKVIMVQGTASNAGKSLITAALCRIFMQDGYKVAPFKAQNMGYSVALDEGPVISGAQMMQAEACGCTPDVRMNPVLLVPVGEQSAEVFVNGISKGVMQARDYFAAKNNFIPMIMEAYASLATENDIIVIEGAGSPAEINLKQEDIVNMGMARRVKAPVLLVGDIDRGGLFAAMYGTMQLLDQDERELVKGVIINRFRGDREILRPGEKMLEQLIKRPLLGVIPYFNLMIGQQECALCSAASFSANNSDEFRQSQYDIISTEVRPALNMAAIYNIVESGC